MVDLIDWFDIENPDHMKAYDHLQKKSTWPVNFLPADMIIPSDWYMMLHFKLAAGYVKLFNERQKINEGSL